MSEDRQGIFGVDLGTTYSAVSYIDDTGRPVIARNALGDETTPSVIFFESETNIVIGATAKDSAYSLPAQVASLVKREMGNKDYERIFFGKEYSAPALSSLILKALAAYAGESGRKLDRAVITVPAYFGMLEKAATRQAGELAGIDVIGIVPEPVAAALAYGLGLDGASRTILVYDLGGGTFDVTIIRIGADEIRVLAVDGNSKLGGADWDAIVVEHLVQEVIDQIGDDTLRDDDIAMQELWNEAEKTKKRLSSKQTLPVNVRYTGGAATVVISRDQFEQMTQPLLDQTIDITKRVLATVESLYPGTKTQISDVILVGGSSRMPAVKAALQREFSWEPKLADPDLAVAKGAALYAAGQWGKIVDWDHGDERASLAPPTEKQKEAALEKAALETDIPLATLKLLGQREIVSALPKAIGVNGADESVDGWDDPSSWVDGEQPQRIVHLVDAQTEVPLREPKVFTALTSVDSMSGIDIGIWEQAGEVAGPAVADNRALASGVIEGLGPLRLPKHSPVEISLFIDGDGVALLTAREPRSGKSVEVKAKIELLDATEMAKAQAAVAGLVVTT